MPLNFLFVSPLWLASRALVAWALKQVLVLLTEGIMKSSKIFLVDCCSDLKKVEFTNTCTGHCTPNYDWLWISSSLGSVPHPSSYKPFDLDSRMRGTLCFQWKRRPCITCQHLLLFGSVETLLYSSCEEVWPEEPGSCSHVSECVSFQSCGFHLISLFMYISQIFCVSSLFIIHLKFSGYFIF